MAANAAAVRASGSPCSGTRRTTPTKFCSKRILRCTRRRRRGATHLHFFAPALQAAVNARAAMEDDLRQAIKTNDFRLYYQVSGGSRHGDRGRGADPLETPEARLSGARRIHSFGGANRTDSAAGRLGAGNSLQTDCGVGAAQEYGASDGGGEHQRAAVAEPGLRARMCWRRWSALERIRGT